MARCLLEHSGLEKRSLTIDGTFLRSADNNKTYLVGITKVSLGYKGVIRFSESWNVTFDGKTKCLLRSKK